MIQSLSKMVPLELRTGRQNQRYCKGRRLVVGCIPYRYKKTFQTPSNLLEEMEVLVISSQKCDALMFPKGGWENDETMQDAAARETREEAGVVGRIEDQLGKWLYKGKSNGILHEGYMFPLFVKEELDHWPEGNARKRRWMKLSEAREASMSSWMKEALELLVCRLVNSQQQEDIRDAAPNSE